MEGFQVTYIYIKTIADLSAPLGKKHVVSDIILTEKSAMIWKKKRMTSEKM